jgi:hypothetical protein
MSPTFNAVLHYSCPYEPLSFNDSPSVGAPCDACCYLLGNLVNYVVEMACQVRLCLVWFSLRGVGGRSGVGGGGGLPPRVLGTLRAQSITVAVDFTLRTAEVGCLW